MNTLKTPCKEIKCFLQQMKLKLPGIKIPKSFKSRINR